MQDDEQVTAPEADASAPGDMNGYRMLLFRASHAQRQLMHPFMASVGLGTGQPKLLSYLAEYGSSSPRDMADFYELDPAGVSRMLDALAGKGFVKIEPHAADRRSKVVSLTPEGARVACAWNAACAEEAEAMLAGFAPEEREAFADYLRRTTGWEGSVVGKRICVTSHNYNNKSQEICGVFEDYRLGTISYTDDRPIALFCASHSFYQRGIGVWGNVLVRYHRLTPEALQHTRELLARLVPTADLPVYAYKNELVSMYIDTRNFRDSITIGGAVALAILIIGLVGGGTFSITSLVLNLLLPGLYVYGAVQVKNSITA